MLNLSPDTTTCQFCGKPLRGRIDKKFCDFGCKNEFNNLIYRQERHEIGRIDLILKHNRRALKACLGALPSRRVSETELLQRGLRFEYYTHQYINARQDKYCFCYDYGYLVLGEGRCVVVKESLGFP
jgi:hypothetical protein